MTQLLSTIEFPTIDRAAWIADPTPSADQSLQEVARLEVAAADFHTTPLLTLHNKGRLYPGQPERREMDTRPVEMKIVGFERPVAPNKLSQMDS
jgi:hypothetical protein